MFCDYLVLPVGLPALATMAVGSEFLVMVSHG